MVDKNKYNVPNFDFATLYPNVIKDWTKDEKFMAELKEIARKRLIKERKEKLERINEL